MDAATIFFVLFFIAVFLAAPIGLIMATVRTFRDKTSSRITRGAMLTVTVIISIICLSVALMIGVCATSQFH